MHQILPKAKNTAAPRENSTYHTVQMVSSVFWFHVETPTAMNKKPIPILI